MSECTSSFLLSEKSFAWSKIFPSIAQSSSRHFLSHLDAANSLSEHHPVPWLWSNLFFCNCAPQLFSSDNLFKVVSASQDHNRVIQAERVAHFVRRSESFERKPKYAFDRCFAWTKSHCFHANRCFCFHSLNLEFYIHDFHTLCQTYVNAQKHLNLINVNKKRKEEECDPYWPLTRPKKATPFHPSSNNISSNYESCIE